jgi:hypothetical protein
MTSLSRQPHTAARPSASAAAPWLRGWAGLLLTSCGFMAA